MYTKIPVCCLGKDTVDMWKVKMRGINPPPKSDPLVILGSKGERLREK